MNNANNDQLFQNFIQEYQLSERQAEQFQLYLQLLLTARQQFNLTAITTIPDAINYHFRDSLALTRAFDISSIASFADVGTGGGLPGIPLKICFPHCAVTLIEVNSKKVAFLHEVIEKLQLDNVRVVQADWRTVLRTTDYPIDLFVSRASLHTDELMRLFRPGCFYRNAVLVYWASQHWEISPLEKSFFWKEYEYTIQHKKRVLVFFKAC